MNTVCGTDYRDNIPRADRGWRSSLPVLFLSVCMVACLLAVFPRPVRAGEKGRELTDQKVPTVAGNELSKVVEACDKYLDKWNEQHPDQLKKRSDIYALARLYLTKARLTIRDYWPSETRDQRVKSFLNKARGLIVALRDQKSPGLTEHGRFERAYLASNDGSAQPYLLYVPPSYDGSKPYGLLVYLHGYSPDLNRENWVRYMYADVLSKYARQTRSIVLMPFARSNTDFQGCGEDDVMRALHEVKEDYKIDPNRIVLSGYSMGGMGVWTIGAHYPDQFAALLPISSRADFYYWKNLKPDDIPGFKQKMAEQEFGANLLPNYRHLPVYMIHGSVDFGIPVEQSRRMKARLDKNDRDVQYVELEGKGHVFFYRQRETMPELVQWLRARKRVTDPRRISFRTYTLSYPRAYWVKINGIKNWGKAAEVNCVVKKDGEQIELTTKNVSGLILDPPRKLLKRRIRDVVVRWNGQKVQPELRDGYLVLAGNEKEKRDDGMVKTPELCGPMREVFSGPFVMVHGGAPEKKKEGNTSGDGERATGYRLARLAAADWENFARGTPTVLAADDVDRETIQKNNLILFGVPSNNELVAKVIDKMPVNLTDEVIELAGHRYDLEHHGLWLIYPNPLNKKRYVVLNAGVPWGKELPSNHKYDMIPDFMVYTAEKSSDGTESNRYRAAGFFNQYWELASESTWFSKEPK